MASANLHDLYKILAKLKQLRKEAEGAGFTSGKSTALRSLEEQLSKLEPVTIDAARKALSTISNIDPDVTSSIDELKEASRRLEAVHQSANAFRLLTPLSQAANALRERYERCSVLASVKAWYQDHQLLAEAGDAALVKDVVTAILEADEWHKIASRFDLPHAWVERLKLIKELGKRKVKAELARLDELDDNATRTEIETAISGVKCQILEIGDEIVLARLVTMLQKNFALRQDIWEPHNTTTETVTKPSFMPMHAVKPRFALMSTNTKESGISTTVPGFEEDGLTWYDTPNVVTINMPISADDLRSFAVHTDGSTLSLSWDGGSVRAPERAHEESHERSTDHRDSRRVAVGVSPPS